jgi:ATP-binding cassette subfamily B protein
VKPTGESDWGRLRRTLPYLRGDGWLYVLALLCAPASALLTVAQPWLMKVAIDEHIVPGRLEGLQEAALLYLGAVVVAFVMEAAYTLTLSYAAMRTITRLRRHVYQHTLGLAQSFWDREPTGKMLTRATSDVEALGETLTAGAITIVLDVMLVFGILAAMLALDPWLTAVMVLVAPVLGVAIEGIRRILRKLYLTVRTTIATLNAYMAERLTGLRVVQLYSDEQRALQGFRDRNKAYRDATIKTNIYDAALYAIVDGLSSVTMALMLWYGASDWFDSAVTAGLLAAFIDYVSKLFTPIREFSAKLAVIQRANSALEKIFSLLDHDERVPEGTVELPPPERLDGHLVARDLHFAYGDGPDVLKGIDVTLAPGEVVALVGRTGSGKTTLGKILLRAYGGYRGSLQLDGVEHREITTESVRRAVGMVHQDVQLYPGTVRFNLALGADLSDAQLQEAIDLAHAGPVVERLGGLDGRIEHEGRNVSVGEAQLLAFARTMAHDAPIVILDEATASVDTLTEERIQAATQALLARKTVLVIAHRLSTVVGADRILVLGAGEVLEQGDHASLMAARGIYRDLFDSQFATHVA